MSNKQIALDVAAFLDSDEARALSVPDADTRRITQLFIELCYDDLGKKPRLLDGHDMHTLVGHLMPGRLKRKDPLAAHVPAVLSAYLDHLETVATVSESFEIRRGLDATVDEFQETVRTGQNAHHHAPKQDPFVHGAAKLGRNDPCSCGSGKKYKKCHGKNA
jgi:hypothetical protein